MKLPLLIFSAFLLSSAAVTAQKKDSTASSKNGFKNFFPVPANENSPESKLVDSIYKKAALYTYGLDRKVFFDAYKGYQYLLAKGKLTKTDLLTIADYSQSAKNKRLYVIDVKQGKLIHNTFVSHGRGSGAEFASDFSNAQSSNKSSLGFMITGETYVGTAGYSLRLDGVEDGINDQVRIRNVVMHGSKFVNYERIYERGTIGNSLGCPAIPLSDHKLVIDKIKGGSCLFIYSDVPHYKRISSILNASFSWPSLKAITTTDSTSTAQQTSSTVTGN